jgi:hypothetical protein
MYVKMKYTSVFHVYLVLDVLLTLDTDGKLTTEDNFITNGMISVSPSSTSLIYIAIFHHHQDMMFISHS